MMTPAVSSGSVLLAGMYGSTVPAGTEVFAASAMRELSSRSAPAVKRDRRPRECGRSKFDAGSRSLGIHDRGQARRSLDNRRCREASVSAVAMADELSGTLERADVDACALRTLNTIVIMAKRRCAIRVCSVERRAVHVQMIVATGTIDERGVASLVAHSPDIDICGDND